MSNLDQIVSVTITTESGGLSQAGFGMPLILGYPLWVERVRYYTDMEGVAQDFVSSKPEYKAAAAIFAQNPRPEMIAIGRGTNKPTQRWFLTVVAVANARTYAFDINGTEVSYTSDSTATNDEITAGLLAAGGATATAAGFTLAEAGAAGSKYLTLTANAAGNWASVEVLNPSYLSLAQNHADPGVEADLDAIKLIADDWYCLITLFNSEAVIAAAASWTESNEKFYLAATQDTAVVSVAEATPATDIAHDVKASNYFRTAVIYHPDNGAFADAAWAGRCLPLIPGSETWKFKTLATVPVVALNPTYLTNLRDKRANYYYTVAGRAITADGKVGGNEWIDVIRFRDWLKVKMQERIALLLFNSDKVPYTDAGIAAVEKEVRAQLREGVNAGGLAEPFTVTVPKAKDAAPADRAARILRSVTFEADLAGAIHEIRIRGKLVA